MGIPVYVSGQVLNASDCNNWFVPQAAYFTGTQLVNSVTMANVTGVAISSLGTGTYRLKAGFYWTPTTNAGSAVFRWTTSTATVTPMQVTWLEVVATAAPGGGPGGGEIGNSGMVQALNSNMQSATMGTTDRYFTVEGMFTVTVSGDFTLQAACTNAADTFTIKFGTFLELQRFN